MDADHGRSGVLQLEQLDINFDSDKTVWLAHDRITGAAAIAAADLAGGRSAVIHHMSYDHYEPYAETTRSAYDKTRIQTELFQKADIVLAVGPLLRDAAADRLGGSKPVHMMIPGLAEITPKLAPNTFVVFLSGRLSNDAVRIKQAHLGIAAFASAERQALKDGMPDSLCKQPKLLLRGVDFDGRFTVASGELEENGEAKLRKFAQTYANASINLHSLPYTSDREQLYSELSSASVALMLSWHEGFGLVAWEAIAAGVPLICSKKSGVYQFLEEQYPGAEVGYIHALQIAGAEEFPFFSNEDLETTVAMLKEIAKDPERERMKASTLREILRGKHRWPDCVEQAVKAFGWDLNQGSIVASMPTNVSQTQRSTPLVIDGAQDLLRMPAAQWQANAGMAVSQLLRAEEGVMPFDPDRQPELDSLNVWLDDQRWPQAIRLMTAAGGQGKTRLAIELCHQRRQSGWYAGFLDNNVGINQMAASWQTLRHRDQPLLIVIDYAETRQTTFLSLLNATLQTEVSQPVRILLLARSGGEWWDNLPSKDPKCEALLSGYATTGPFRLPPLYQTVKARQHAYTTALRAFASVLGVAGSEIVPDLAGEHFERPLYVQMAALLALYGEQPITSQGLTKALLNHERRYWSGLLAHFNWPEPERNAEQILALATLAGGFPTARAAEPYWTRARAGVLTSKEFNLLFREVALLYPGTEGLGPLRPDLLGEALVAQALLQFEGGTLLDGILSNSATQMIRRNGLTVLARLSTQRADLQEMLVDVLSRHFADSCTDIVAVSTETTGRLPEIAELAFERLSSAEKSQVSGLLAPLLIEESIQLGGLSSRISGYLIEKALNKLKKKPGNVDRMAEYARALYDHAIDLSRIGSYQLASDVGLKGLELFRELATKYRERFESMYGRSSLNYTSYLIELGQYKKALPHAIKTLKINKRLAKKNPEPFDPQYARSLNNYSCCLRYAGRKQKALKYAGECAEIFKRLTQQNPGRFWPDYAQSLNYYAAHFLDADDLEKALEHGQKAFELSKALAAVSPDRFEPAYAESLFNYATYLSYARQNKLALEYAHETLEIYNRLSQKNPERFEPRRVTSLAHYAFELSLVGHYEQALTHAREAFELGKRLARERPDRFEPVYVESLTSYSDRLNETGQTGLALKHDREAVEILERLAQNNQSPFAESLFLTKLNVRFLEWLCSDDDPGDQPSLDELPSFESEAHLRLLLSAFVMACGTTDRSVRSDSLRTVLSSWNKLSIIERKIAEPYWFCASAWVSKLEHSVDADWKMAWGRYVSQRSGRIPSWMLEVGRRLEFEWPR